MLTATACSICNAAMTTIRGILACKHCDKTDTWPKGQ